jgi:hypothetical protein
MVWGMPRGTAALTLATVLASLGVDASFAQTAKPKPAISKAAAKAKAEVTPVKKVEPPRVLDEKPQARAEAKPDPKPMTVTHSEPAPQSRPPRPIAPQTPPPARSSKNFASIDRTVVAPNAPVKPVVADTHAEKPAPKPASKAASKPADRPAVKQAQAKSDKHRQ